LARLTTAGRIPPIITVAIPTDDNRLQEYGTAIAPNSRSLGVLAGAYTHFVIAELMPRIEAEFRARGPATFLGVSLGGLSAFDIAWNHPERFGAIGVMSGSLWWHAAEDETRIDAGQRIAHALVRRSLAPPPLRLWFQAGTRDEVCDRDGNGVIDAIQDTLELMDELRAIGIHPDDLAYVEVAGGRHDYETWRRVLPDFLTWVFTPGPGR
jgi:enterochelin esterase-like enzyme